MELNKKYVKEVMAVECKNKFIKVDDLIALIVARHYGEGTKDFLGVMNLVKRIRSEVRKTYSYRCYWRNLSKEDFFAELTKPYVFVWTGTGKICSLEYFKTLPYISRDEKEKQKEAKAASNLIQYREALKAKGVNFDYKEVINFAHDMCMAKDNYGYQKSSGVTLTEFSNKLQEKIGKKGTKGLIRKMMSGMLNYFGYSIITTNSESKIVADEYKYFHALRVNKRFEDIDTDLFTALEYEPKEEEEDKGLSFIYY